MFFHFYTAGKFSLLSLQHLIYGAFHASFAFFENSHTHLIAVERCAHIFLVNNDVAFHSFYAYKAFPGARNIKLSFYRFALALRMAFLGFSLCS